MTVDLKVIENLILNENYVFLRTDAGYDPDKKNSIKDYYNLSTIQAQTVKRDPVIQSFIKSIKAKDVVIVDSSLSNNNDNAVEEIANVTFIV